MAIHDKHQPERYRWMLCSKTMQETLASSLANSFQKWIVEGAQNDNPQVLEQLKIWSKKVAQQPYRTVDDCLQDLSKLLQYYFKDIKKKKKK